MTAARRVFPFVGVLRCFTKVHSAVDQPHKAGGVMKLFVRSLFVALLVLGVLSLGIAAEAQTSNSAIILGTITDKAGAVVPDATVGLMNTATNETKTATTNAAAATTRMTIRRCWFCRFNRCSRMI